MGGTGVTVAVAAATTGTVVSTAVGLDANSVWVAAGAGAVVAGPSRPEQATDASANTIAITKPMRSNARTADVSFSSMSVFTLSS